MMHFYHKILISLSHLLFSRFYSLFFIYLFFCWSKPTNIKLTLVAMLKRLSVSFKFSVQQFRCCKIKPLFGHTFFLLPLFTSWLLSFFSCWHSWHAFCSAHQLFQTISISLGHMHFLTLLMCVCVGREKETLCMSVSNT